MDAAEVLPPEERFGVHPHVEKVGVKDPLLLGYLGHIYDGTRSVRTPYPTSESFASLASRTNVRDATREIAGSLALSMSRKRANPGILFGFLIALDGGEEAHGLVKADLDREQRFHFASRGDGSWSLAEVHDMLPPPKTQYAKFVIAPRPTGEGAAGIRDLQTAPSAAADYFLAAVGLVVEQTKGGKAALANEAYASGYSDAQIAAGFDDLREVTPVADVVERYFPDIPATRVKSLQGSPTRPLRVIRPDDQYQKVFRTRKPRFELRVDASVDVKIDGRVITVTLPPDSDKIDRWAT